MQDAIKNSELREIELKLEVDPNDVERFKMHRCFRSAGVPRQLDAVYFDTPKFTLRDNGISFRVRQDGDKRVQTIKAEGLRSGVALDRGEWEHEISSASPDFTRALHTPLQPFVQDGGARKIQPVFTVHAERLVGLHSVDGAEIELALDNARVQADNRQAAFAEIEVELKSGDPKHLFDVALELATTGPVRLSTRTKSARGYALLEKPSSSVKAEKVTLQPDQNTAAAFQTIARSCLRQLIGNETILRANANPDAVHQARVAIRRLRAALSLFGTVVIDPMLPEVKSKLKGMAEPLGRARDLDLFIEKVLRPVRKRDAAMAEMFAAYQGQRDSAYAEALETVSSAQFGLSLLQVAAWVETGPWLTQSGQPSAGLRNIPVQTFAAGELGRRWTKVRKRLKGIGEIDEEARHRVRIEIKKLRYATEFFSSLYSGAGQKRMRAAQTVIEALQSVLGDLNDIAVARQTAAASGSGALVANRERDIAGLLSQAEEHARAFRKLQPYWTAAA